MQNRKKLRINEKGVSRMSFKNPDKLKKKKPKAKKGAQQQPKATTKTK